jgi:hypothetical protein
MSNWEDRFASHVNDAALPWEERLKHLSFNQTSPAESTGTLQVGPVDTGIPLPTGVQNFLAGAGKAYADTARGLGQKVGLVSSQDVADSRALDAPLMSTKAARYGNVAGSVAQSLPLVLVPGANTLAGSAVAGSGYGLAQPATSTSEAVGNTLEGGVGGVVGNVIGRGIGAAYGVAKGVVQPFFASGRQAIVDHLLQSAEPNLTTALHGLRTNAGEIVPGSLPTAPEAAGTVGLARLAKGIKQADPATAQAFSDRVSQQNAARVAALNTVAPGAAARAAAVDARNAAVKPLYDSAKSKTVELDPQLQSILNTPAGQAVAANVDKNFANARNVGVLPGNPETPSPIEPGVMIPEQPPTISGDYLHQMKLEFDALSKMKPITPADRAQLAGIGDARDAFNSWLENKIPEYGVAKKVYADMSPPINQMDVGQALHDKLVPALNDFGATRGLNANAYAKALRDGDVIAQQVTGMKDATMASTLDPSQYSLLTGVGQDLARSANATQAAAAAGSDTAQNLVTQNLLRQTLGPTGLPQSWAENTLLQSVLRPAQYVAALAEPRVLSQAGQTLLDPASTAAALSRANPNPYAVALQLRRLGIPGDAAMMALSGNTAQQ